MNWCASADQRRELEAIFQGTKGGPMAIVGGLVTTWLPTRTTQIAIQEQGGTVTATVAGCGQVHSQRLTNEAGQPTIYAVHDLGNAERGFAEVITKDVFDAIQGWVAEDAPPDGPDDPNGPDDGENP